MGFNGGGSGSLPAHEHTTISNDGGPLDLNGVTVGSLNAGSVVYSDGAALQELTIGGANTVLQSSGAVPQWAAAGGVSLNLSTNETTTQQSSSSTSFIDITNTSATLGSGSGNAICTFDSFMQAGEGIIARWSFSTDGDQTEQHFNSSVPEKFQRTLTAITSTLSSQTVKVQAKNSAASTMYFAVDTSGVTRVYVLEIS